MEFSPIEKRGGTAQPDSDSVVPGISDQEMTKRLMAIQGSKPVLPSANMPPANQSGTTSVSPSPAGTNVTPEEAVRQAVEDSRKLDHIWGLLREARAEQLAELEAGEFSHAVGDEQNIGEYLRIHHVYASHLHMLLLTGDLGNEDRVKALKSAVEIVYQKEQIEQDLSDEILKFDFRGRPAVLVEDFKHSRRKIEALNAVTESVLAVWQ